MGKKIIFAGWLWASAHAVAAPSVWSVYNCSQPCGLTENTYSSVSFQSIDLLATKSALSDLCEAQNLHLQGRPNCTQTNNDFTTNESYQRCRQGVGVGRSCNVAVVGYNRGDTSPQYFYAQSSSSFADAESKAMGRCRTQLNSYSSQCIINNYYIQ